MENFIDLKPHNNQKYSSNQINDAFSRKTKEEKKFLKSLDKDKNKNKNKIKIDDVINTTNDAINTTINKTIKNIKTFLNYPNKEHFNSSSVTIGVGLFYIIMLIIVLFALYIIYFIYCHFYKKKSDCSLHIFEKVTNAFGRKHNDASPPSPSSPSSPE